jgi:hypothetical protein
VESENSLATTWPNAEIGWKIMDTPDIDISEISRTSQNCQCIIGLKKWKKMDERFGARDELGPGKNAESQKAWRSRITEPQIHFTSCLSTGKSSHP